MNFEEYREKAFSTCTPACYSDEYLSLGFISEVGELAGKFAKRIRGDSVSDEDIMQEIGDCAWMAAVWNRLMSKPLKEDIKHTFLPYNFEHGILEILDVEQDLSFYAVKCFCEWLGYDFAECLRMNLEKLESRQERGVIQGDGDNR